VMPFATARRELARPLGLVIALCAGLAQAAPQTPREWLDAMALAAHQSNYAGTFTYLNNGSLQSMRLVHGYDAARGERDRLISLSGSLREVLRDGDQVTCILPDTQSVKVEHPGPSRAIPILIPSQLEQIAEHYQFAFAGEERVAGRTTRLLVISPRDPHRYTHRFWIDSESHLLLRSELINEEGEAVEQLIFSDITLYDAPPEAALARHTEGVDYVWTHQGDVSPPAPAATTTTGQPQDWSIGFLPAGFVQDTRRHHLSTREKGGMEQLVYSDGLASISIFIEDYREGDAPFIGFSSLGAINAFGKLIDHHHLTVLGEVPKSTLIRVADSVHHQHQE